MRDIELITPNGDLHKDKNETPPRFNKGRKLSKPGQQRRCFVALIASCVSGVNGVTVEVSKSLPESES